MSRRPFFRFRLYVAGEAPNSALAVTNLLALCRTHLAGRHEVEIIDVLREPQTALANGIFMTPMLVKLAPGPVRHIVGTLCQLESVLQDLGLTTQAA